MSSGQPVLYVALNSHHLLAFIDDEAVLHKAFNELTYTLRHLHEGNATFHDVNGEPLTNASPYVPLLHAAGLVATPKGMKLYT